MATSKNQFTFIWKIKNFNFIQHEIFSPSFFIPEMNETKWILRINPNSVRHKGCAACYLQRDVNDSGPEHFKLDYELSFLHGDGALKSEIFLKNLYQKGEFKEALHANRDEIFFHKKDLFIPHDVLTIRCRMWDSREIITQSGRCSAETSIKTERITSVGTITNFSSTERAPSWRKHLARIKWSSTIHFLSSMSLCVDTGGQLFIEIKVANQKSLCMYRHKIFIRNIYGNKLKFGQEEFRNNETHKIPLTLTKEYLMENKREYLPNDVLTIECETTFPTDMMTEKIDEPEFGFDFQDTKKIIMHVTETNLSSKEYHFYIPLYTTLKDDFRSLFRDTVLCDINLKTATETFPAHKAVLSARSPVFKSMFTSEMKEKTNKCVDIDDLDADTVRQMLLFMYSDTLKDLNYESAKSLYFAADKYDIVSLKLRCASFLKQNLLLLNCCEILLLADKHQDNELKLAVKNFIMKNDKKVLLSEEWKNLEKNNSQLTTEVLRTIYLKVRGI